MTKKLTTEEFIQRAVSVHGGRYNYSKVIYLGQMANVTIICPEHGEFEQAPSNHLAGKGCGECGRKVTEAARKLSDAEFKRRVGELHEDAVRVTGIYKGWDDRVECECKEHGLYLALPAVLLRKKGNGCLKCAIEIRGPDRLTSEQFIERAKEVHGDKYDYSHVRYTTFLKNVEIVCKEHGAFLQSPCNHIAGKGCFRCVGAQSKSELEIKEFIENGYNNKVRERARDVIPPLELDIYIPEKRIAVEFNGIYWHSADINMDAVFRRKHREKMNRCMNENIRLIQIREDKYLERKEVFKSIIANAIGFGITAIHGRECVAREISSEDAMSFLNENHLDGATRASVCIGLFYKETLVTVMTFSRPRYSAHHDWEIARFASKTFMRISGGAGKLLSYFRGKYKGSIITYCDLEHGTGAVYKAIGMREVGESSPGYVWVKNGQKAYSRYQTQKHKLAGLLPNFDESKSEAQNMFAHGFRRYWDSGNLVFELR